MCFTDKIKRNWIKKDDRVPDPVQPPGPGARAITFLSLRGKDLGYENSFGHCSIVSCCYNKQQSLVVGFPKSCTLSSQATPKSLS